VIRQDLLGALLNDLDLHGASSKTAVLSIADDAYFLAAGGSSTYQGHTWLDMIFFVPF
jgi:hypothetical protein